MARPASNKEISKTVKTISALAKSLFESDKKHLDVIYFTPDASSRMIEMDTNLFSFINSNTEETYKKCLPKIVFKDLKYIGAMFNNVLLNDWILDKIEFENSQIPLSFHGIFKNNKKISEDAIQKFYLKYRNKDRKMYGSGSDFINETLMPDEFNELVVLYLTLDFLRLKVLPKFDYICQILVSPHFNEKVDADRLKLFIERGVLI